LDDRSINGALVLDSLVKVRCDLCQGKTEGKRYFLVFSSRKDHVPRANASTAAFVVIKTPICRRNVIPGRVRKATGSPVDGGFGPLEFQKSPDGCFIEDHDEVLQTREAVSGPELFIPEPRPQSQTVENHLQPACVANPDLNFLPDLVPLLPRGYPFARDWGFVCKEGVPNGRMLPILCPGWRFQCSGRNLDAQTKEAPRLAKVTLSIIVERVRFKDPTTGNGTEPTQETPQAADFTHPEFYFNFAVGRMRHGDGLNGTNLNTEIIEGTKRPRLGMLASRTATA
jgi:hypothetical protein